MGARTLVLAAVVIAVGACSWIHVRTPPPGPVTAAQAPDCDPDSAWPLVDSSIAIASFAGMLLGLVWSVHADPPESTKQLAGAGLLGLGLSGVLWIYSSAHGERATSACAALHRGSAR